MRVILFMSFFNWLFLGVLFFTKSFKVFFFFFFGGGFVRRWSVSLDSVIILAINFTITGQVKLGIHAMRLCQISSGSGSNVNIKNDTLVSLLSLLDSSIAFNSIFLRHHIFCIIQILSGRWACFSFSFGLNSFFSNSWLFQLSGMVGFIWMNWYG